MGFFCSFLRCANKVSRVYGYQSCEGLFQLLVIRCWWVYASTWLHLEARGLSCSMAVAETAIMAFHRYHGYWGYPISFRGLVFLVRLGGWHAKTIQWNKPCRWLKPSEKGCLHIDSGMVISSWICLPEPKGNPFTDRQQLLCSSIAKSHGMLCSFFGGFESKHLMWSQVSALHIRDFFPATSHGRF